MTDLSTVPATTVDAASLTDLLGLSPIVDDGSCPYVVAGSNITAENLLSAARLIADDAMALRCGNSTALSRWRRRAAGGPPHTPTERSALEGFVVETFGLPPTSAATVPNRIPATASQIDSRLDVLSEADPVSPAELAQDGAPSGFVDPAPVGNESAEHPFQGRIADHPKANENAPKPLDPDTSDTHLEGFVAELIWHRLAEERREPVPNRVVRHVPPISWSPLDHGGDGLVVFEVSGTTLIFRLWEIKKHTAATSSVGSVVQRASGQLAKNAARYLAQITSYNSMLGGDLGSFYGEISDLWAAGDERAGVGVAVAAQRTPKKTPFGTLAKTFAHLDSSQRDGLLVVIPDFVQFAKDVRQAVWNGL